MMVTELKGPKALKALNAYCALLWGLKMIPQYIQYDFEDFFAMIADFPDDQKRIVFKEAAMMVELQEDELKSLVSFVKDPNGVPYSAENINNLKPTDLLDIVVAVCMEISSWEIDLVSESEKKKSKSSQLTSDQPLQSTPKHH